MKIEPVLIEKPWGGTFISERFNLPRQKLGEALLVSTLENQENKIELNQNLSSKVGKLPYLIKLIDAEDNLSVQVHPNDHFASLLENSVGKTECWLVDDVLEGAGIYFGLKDGVSTDIFYDRIKNQENVVSLMNFVPVKKYDFIIVPAGTIHAIGAGVRIVEFQQSSGITYRIWDWNRPGRELHIEKALQVSNPIQLFPEVLKFEEMTTGIFFSHHDFSLKKISKTKITCSSVGSSSSVEFNLEDFSFVIR